MRTCASFVSAWDHPVKKWMSHGLECQILKAPCRGAHNGYVRMPQEYQDQNLTYDELNESVEVHGGLTHGMDKERWIGFDTLHYGDVWEEDPSDPCQVLVGARWTMDRLVAEVENLARQIAEMVGTDTK